MICRRWCIGVTVVVVAVGMGGIPAAAQQSPLTVEVPKVEVPAVTVPPLTVPVPGGGPAIATPPISTPAISTPPVRTPPIETPIGSVPSVSVPSVKVAPVTVSPVRTVPAQSTGKPVTGGNPDGAPTEDHLPSASGSPDRIEPRTTPALAVRSATAHHAAQTSPVPPRRAAADTRLTARSTARPRAASSPTHPVARGPAQRDAPRAASVVEQRATPVPVADSAERHDGDARPLVDGLDDALRLAPLLMALALGGALCAVTSRLRRAA
jgi:hypothetical protein